MGPFEIVTIVVVGLAMLAIAGYLIYNKVSGKGGDCGYSSCPHCASCNAAKRKRHTKK